MQHTKNTTNFSELETIVTDKIKMTSALADVMEKFNLKSHFGIFDMLKSKGLAISSLLNILVILPFYGFSSIYAMFKSGLNSIDIEGKKDAYYDAKNDERIDWRTLLLFHAKRFKYLTTKNVYIAGKGIRAIIFDDSLIEKTGKKTERVSMVNDHAVFRRFVLGYKLLVCGFWDGSSFIPIDFSLHREKGTKQDKLIAEHKKAKRECQKAKANLERDSTSLKKKEEKLMHAKQLYAEKPTKTNKGRLERATASYQKAKRKFLTSNRLLLNKEHSLEAARKRIKRHYSKERLFGLTPKERRGQFKKDVAKSSFGNKRRLETDSDKITSMLKMLGRAVKNGFVPEYVLTDSWFFCFRLLEKLRRIKKGTIKLLSMVKINNQVFTICETGKNLHANKIPEVYRKQEKVCRKLKSKYIKIACYYKGIRVNLFYVKMGRAQTWHLLLTTDLNLTFMKLMEIYQIRWTIEVFFKESKQYLNLGGCKSSNFDAQIADMTISMMQHIMLTYFKRLNYQQSFGDLFNGIKKEAATLDLVTRMLEFYLNLLECLCLSAGIDFIMLQRDLVSNVELMNQFEKLIPNRFNKAA